jgi:hypothetical protein
MLETLQALCNSLEGKKNSFNLLDSNDRQLYFFLLFLNKLEPPQPLPCLGAAHRKLFGHFIDFNEVPQYTHTMLAQAQSFLTNLAMQQPEPLCHRCVLQIPHSLSV